MVQLAGEQNTMNEMSNDELMSKLVDRFGGMSNFREALYESVQGDNTAKVSSSKAMPDEDDDGYCYLRFFDSIDRIDAISLGAYPTVAEVRRFTNSRSDPFGSRNVIITVLYGHKGRVAHVSYNSSAKGLRPVQALSALARDLRVGGLPDGVSENFPPDWIPSKRVVYQTWDYIVSGNRRNLNVLDWLGPNPVPGADSHLYEPISSPYSRVKWVVRASPVGPVTGKVDVIDADGQVKTVRFWESLVGPWGYYQNFAVRGDKVFVEAHVWRPAKVTTTPGAPAPTPPARGGDKDELLTLTNSDSKGTLGGNVKVQITDCAIQHADFGRCYLRMFKDAFKSKAADLGRFPTVESILAFLMVEHARAEVSGEDIIRDNLSLNVVSDSLYHVDDGNMDGGTFLEQLFNLPMTARVGATQGDAVTLNKFENVAAPASLTIQPKNAGMLINIPFATKLTMDKPQLYWDMSAGKKLGGLMSYFESVQLVSLKLKATVHKGDADTLLSVAADTTNSPFKSEMDWVAAAHTMHVSGNVNGATTGELVLEGNHGFGTQLQGLSVGNPTPIVQAYLETAVVANVLLKAVLAVRVSGTGNPTAIILPSRESSMSRGLGVADDSEEEENPRITNHIAKRR